MTGKRSSALWLSILVIAVMGCTREEEHAAPPEVTAKIERIEAVATLAPAEGYHASGQVVFEQSDGKVRITGNLGGLSPGPHAIQIDEFGGCRAPDGSLGGDILHPNGALQGAPGQGQGGDLGNITAEADGHVSFEMTDSLIRLAGDDSVIGRALVVHAGPGDFTSQPTGKAEPRVACGIIKKR